MAPGAQLQHCHSQRLALAASPGARTGPGGTRRPALTGWVQAAQWRACAGSAGTAFQTAMDARATAAREAAAASHSTAGPATLARRCPRQQQSTHEASLCSCSGKTQATKPPEDCTGKICIQREGQRVCKPGLQLRSCALMLQHLPGCQPTWQQQPLSANSCASWPSSASKFARRPATDS